MQSLLPLLLGLATIGIGYLTVHIQRQQARTSRLQAAIARQQANTNRQQYRLTLFEKRYAVFQATMALIGDVMRDGDIHDVQRLFQFTRDTSQHVFLFGSEIKEYLDEIYKKGVDVHTQGQLPEGQADPQQWTNLMQWFTNQIEIATEKFGKYMDFTKP